MIGVGLGVGIGYLQGTGFKLAHPVVVDKFAKSLNTPLGSASTGQAWEFLNSTWKVVEGQAVQDTFTSGLQTAAVIESGISDFVMAVDLSTISSETRIVLRYKNPGNYIQLKFSGADAEGRISVAIRLAVDGAVNQQGSSEPALIRANDTVEITAIGPSIIVQVNGTVLLNYSTTTHMNGTKHGFGGYGSTAPVGFDNFYIYRIVEDNAEYALRFDGVDDYLTSPVELLPKTYTDFTVVTRFMYRSQPTNPMNLWAEDIDASKKKIGLYHNGSNWCVQYFAGDASGSGVVKQSTVNYPLTVGEVYTVMLTYRNSDKNIRVVVNGTDVINSAAPEYGRMNDVGLTHTVFLRRVWASAGDLISHTVWHRLLADNEYTVYSPFTVSQDNLKAHYHTRKRTRDNALLDLSGNGLNMTITGALWIDKSPLKVLYFDGVDDYIDTSKALIPISASYSTITIFRPALDWGGARFPVWSEDMGSTAKHSYLYYESGLFTFCYYDSDANAGGQIVTSSAVNLQAGNMYMISVTYDRPTSTLGMYLNGTQIASSVLPTPLYGRKMDTRHYVMRRRDEYAAKIYLYTHVIYSKALSSTEINQFGASVAVNNADVTHMYSASHASGNSLLPAKGYVPADLVGVRSANPEDVSYTLAFDGVDDYVTVPLDSKPESFTWMTWVKLGALETTTSVLRHSLMSTRTLAEGSGASLNISMRGDGLAQGAFALFESGLYVVRHEIPEGVVPGSWYHVAIVVQRLSGRAAVTLYVDGVPVASTMTTSIPKITSSSLIIGRQYIDATQYQFNGLLRDIRMYSRNLNATEIADAMNGKYVNPNGLMVSTNMSLEAGNTGSTMYNSAGSNGSINGALWKSGAEGM